eukprot:CAMPEP_0172643426 /NCGR_PEP_ID=MMETSP1068-20121228/236893_1 /TAXON_ID=35684 /ORGANISM="Pseudopedinella elastica, Strain CCMP716" /LENGTH=44 /DNA_ID= /DNA_START= /DNA_END= /DNA_ORIENTATION=
MPGEPSDEGKAVGRHGPEAAPAGPAVPPTVLALPGHIRQDLAGP